MNRLGTAALLAAAASLLAAAPAMAVPHQNTNTAEYWSGELSSRTGYTITCTMTSVSGSMSWTADMDYSYVIVKGGSVDYGDGPGNMVWSGVKAGDSVMAPYNAGGQQAAISHLITCEGGYVYDGGGGGGYGGNS